jgi:hypothetical protein
MSYMKNQRSVALTLTLAATLAAPSVVHAQQAANFTLRGTLSETYHNASTGQQEGILHVSGEPHAYIVSCQTQSCANTLIAGVEQCVATIGQAYPYFTSQSGTDEYFAIDIAAIGCSRHRATFFFRGVLENYVPSFASSSGLAEFDLSINGYAHRLICDPLYVNCETRIQQNLGTCIAPTGDIESVVLGFSGDTFVRLWTIFIYTGQGCQ